MKVRLRLNHAVEGEFIASEPDGWVKSVVGYERHPILHTMVLFYRTTFQAYGSNGVDDGGREFFLLVERNHGVNAIITASLERADDDIRFVVIGSQEISIKSFIQAVNFDHNLQFNFKQKSAWTDFIGRYETPVDIRSLVDLKGNAVTPAPFKTISLKSQIVDQVFEMTQKNAVLIGTTYPAEFAQPDFIEEINPTGGKVQVNTDDVVRNEIETNFNIPLLIVNGDRPSPLHSFKYAGLLEYEYKIPFTLFNTNTASPNVTHWYDANAEGVERFKMFLQFNDEEPIEFVRTDKSYTFNFSLVPLGDPIEQTNRWSYFTAVGSREMKVGDQMYIYLENQSIRTGYGRTAIPVAVVYQPYILGTEDNTFELQPYLEETYPGPILYAESDYPFLKAFIPGEPIENYMYMVQHTVYPATNAQGFFIHDAAKAVVERYGVRFNSPFLGNDQTTPSYENNGCGHNYMLFKGLHVRGFTLTEKQFFHSFKSVIEGYGNVIPIGVKEVTIEGHSHIRICSLDEMYPDMEPVVTLYNVKNIKRSYRDEMAYNKVTSGYQEGGNSAAGGLDDPHYTITRASVLNDGEEYEMISEYIAASLLFEQARRSGEKKSDDYPFDNNTFMLSIIKNEGGNYIPETSEVFTDITNLKNGNDRYNLRITPTRNFVRKLKWLCTGVFQYVGSLWRFVEGKGNYKMTSTLTESNCGELVDESLAEDENIPAIKPYFVGNDYELEHYFTDAQWKALQANPYIPIGISQTNTNAKPFIIHDFQYNEFEGTIKAIVSPIDFYELNGNLGNIPAADDEESFDSTFDYTFDNKFN